MSNILPEVVNNFNVYYGEESNQLVGVSGEVELGELEAITDTIEGAGVLGEFEDPVTGQFSDIKIKIPFSILYTDMFDLMDTTTPPMITMRGSQQCMDPTTGVTDYYAVKIVIKGKASNTNLGKLVKGKKGEPELELSAFYIKLTINDKEVIELDKLNFKFSLNGKDMLEKIRQQV